MSGIFRLAALIEVTALLMLALCGRASGCSSWRCGRSHRGVAAHETKDLGLFAYGAKLPLGGAAISMSAVQGPDGKVFVAGQDGNIRALGKVSVTNTDFWRSEATAWAEAWSSTALGSCNVQSSPVIVESSAYSAGSYLVVFACGSRVVAMDGSKATATSIWDVDLCDYFTGTAGQCDWSVGVSSPVLSSNSSVIYLCTGPSQRGSCFALRSTDGRLHQGWNQNPFPSAGDTDTLYMFTSSPAITSTGKLVVGTRYAGKPAVIYLDAETGELVSGAGLSPGTPGVLSDDTTITGSPAAWPDGSVVVCASDGSMLKFGTNSDYSWRKASACGGSTSGTLQPSPAILPGGDIVVAGSNPPTVQRLTDQGVVVWSFCADPTFTSGPCSGGGSVSSSPVYTPSQTIIAAGGGGVLFAISSAGLETWRYATDETTAASTSLTASPIVASDGTVIVGSGSGGVHIVGERPFMSDAVPRLSVEIEVVGVAARNLGDGRLASAKAAIASVSGGLIRSSSITFVRVVDSPSRRRSGPEGEREGAVGDVADGKDSGGVADGGRHGDGEGGIQEARMMGRGTRARRVAGGLLVSFVVTFDTAQQQVTATPLITSANVTSAVASALSATSVTVTISPPALPASTSTPPASTPQSGGGVVENDSASGGTDGAAASPITSPPPLMSSACNPGLEGESLAAQCAGDKCAYAACRCSEVGFCIAATDAIIPGAPPWQIAVTVAGVLFFLGVVSTCAWTWLFRREERMFRQWRKRRQERRERKRARHEARRARQGDVLLEDVQDEDGKRLEQLEEGGEEGEEEGQEREEGVLESGWGPTAMDDDADDGYGDGDREREGSALSRDGDGGESGRLGESTKTGPDRW